MTNRKFDMMEALFLFYCEPSTHACSIGLRRNASQRKDTTTRTLMKETHYNDVAIFAAVTTKCHAMEPK